MGITHTVALLLAILLLIGDIAVVNSHDVCDVYNQTYVDCEKLDLDTIPRNLPSFTTHLDLHQNKISSIPLHSFAHLRKLQYLDVSTNEISNLSSDSLQELHQLTELKLRSNQISHITDNLFLSFRNLLKLDLSSNNIETLSSLSLRGLVNLRELYLYFNSITHIADDAFEDLKNLTVLDMLWNRFVCFPSQSLKLLTNIEIIKSYYGTSVCGDVEFDNLRKLKSIYLKYVHDSALQTIKFGEFPIQELFIAEGLECPINGTLSGVRALTLDLTNNEIQNECLERTLNELQHSATKTLKLGNVFVPMNITSTTLNGLRELTLEELYLMNVHFTETRESAGIFRQLQHLTTLTTWRNFNVPLPRTVFKGLHNLTTLRLQDSFYIDFEFGVFNDLLSLIELQIRSVHFKGKITIDGLLNDLQNITTLEQLYLNKNNLEGNILPNSFVGLIHLKVLDLSRNRITSISSDAFKPLINLKTLDLSHNKVVNMDFNCFSYLIMLESLNIQQIENTDSSGMIRTFDLKNSTNLKYLTMTISNDLAFFLDIPSVEYLYMDGVQESFCLSLYLASGMTHLQSLSIEYECIDIILNTTVPSLASLVLYNIRDSEPPLKPSTMDIFDYIDLFPNVKELSFIGLQDLTNRFTVGMLSKYSHLQKLTITNTQVSEINTQALKKLQNLTSLTFENNHLDCSGCKMEDFVEWMKTDRKVKMEPFNIKCFEPYSIYEKPLLTLTFGLKCNLAFMISVPIASGLTFVAICIALCVRYHWYIRYCCFLIKLKRGGYRHQVNDREQPLNIIYDAFVCYTENDREWVMQQLVPNLENIDPPNFKLCLHERDFMPGIDIFDNILESIETSHKTMLILSPGFARSEWVLF